MKALTIEQASQVHYFERMGLSRVCFWGIDAEDRPTLWVQDARSIVTYALRASDGKPVDVTLPVRPFTDTELAMLPVEDAELLFGLEYGNPPQEAIA